MSTHEPMAAGGADAQAAPVSGISEQEFQLIQRFIYESAGISMPPTKKPLVCARLGRRLEKRRLRSYRDYHALISGGSDPAETQIAIDLLTTNETYFFREPSHFALLGELARAARGRAAPFRAWSAACSSGEEAYSMAMVLADNLDATPWEVIGTDISTRMLDKARAGHYPMERMEYMPPEYLRRYCLRGIGSEQGTLLIDADLRRRVRFSHAGLNTALPDLGLFDVVFLRNVMIYFGDATKREVIARVLSLLRPGGHLCVGHSESLNGLSDAVQALAPSVYRKRHV